MAQTDFGGGGVAPVDIPKYTPSAPVATPGPAASPAISPDLAAQLAALNPSGNPILFAPAPLVSPSANIKETIQASILQDPSYLAGLEQLEYEKKKADERAAQEAAWWEKDYQLALQSLGSSGGGGSSGEAQAAALDALAKEQAAHQKALTEKQIQESLASRGMADSGQTAFEQGELKYNYDNLIKEIDLRAAARRAAEADAASSRASSINSQLANLQLQKEKHGVQVQWAAQDRQDAYVNEKGKLVLSTGQALAGAWWDDGTGTYVGPGGEQWDAKGLPISTARIPSVNDLYAMNLGG